MFPVASYYSHPTITNNLLLPTPTQPRSLLPLSKRPSEANLYKYGHLQIYEERIFSCFDNCLIASVYQSDCT